MSGYALKHVDVSVLASDVGLLNLNAIHKCTVVGVYLTIGQEADIVSADAVRLHVLGHEVDHGDFVVILQHQGTLLATHALPVVNLLATGGTHADGVNLGELACQHQGHAVHDVYRRGATHAASLLGILIGACGRQVAQLFHQIGTVDHVALEENLLLRVCQLVKAGHAPLIVLVEVGPSIVVCHKNRLRTRLSQHRLVVVILSTDQLDGFRKVSTGFQLVHHTLAQP